jgi:ABC-type antimicrobial peptide transport system permease subunit
VQTLDDLVARSVADRRFQAFVLGVFALAALALAAVGVYGLLAYAVRERAQELGLRVALGARSSDILRLVVTQGLTPVMIGVPAGAVAAWWLSRLLRTLLFQISPGDWRSFAIAAVLLGVSAAAACAIPARRATRVDPLEALRTE